MAYTSSRHAGGGGDCTGDVESATDPLRLRESDRGDDQHRADRHVQEESDSPRGEIGEDAAEHESETRAESRDRPVRGDRAGAFASLGEAGREQGEARRGEDRGAEALHRPGSDQEFARGCEPDGQRCGREDRESDDEHAAPPEDVTRACSEQQESTEHERVGGLHPGQPSGAEVEFVPDSSKAGEDDRVVQHDHEVAHEDDRQERAGATRSRVPDAPADRGCDGHG